MAKVKYYAKENSSIGTHSFYAVPIPNGTLTFDELLEEATTTIRQAESLKDKDHGFHGLNGLMATIWPLYFN